MFDYFRKAGIALTLFALAGIGLTIPNQGIRRASAQFGNQIVEKTGTIDSQAIRTGA